MKAISESRNKSNKATLARVKKQMAQPRIAKSAREGKGEKTKQGSLGGGRVDEEAGERDLQRIQHGGNETEQLAQIGREGLFY